MRTKSQINERIGKIEDEKDALQFKLQSTMSEYVRNQIIASIASCDVQMNMLRWVLNYESVERVTDRSDCAKL